MKMSIIHNCNNKGFCIFQLLSTFPIPYSSIMSRLRPIGKQEGQNLKRQQGITLKLGIQKIKSHDCLRVIIPCISYDISDGVRKIQMPIAHIWVFSLSTKPTFFCILCKFSATVCSLLFLDFFLTFHLRLYLANGRLSRDWKMRWGDKGTCSYFSFLKAETYNYGIFSPP